MSLIDYFRSNRNTGSAAKAKERLQILVAHERSERNQPLYLKKMQAELLAVVRSYIEVDQDAISIKMEQDGNQEILELNIVLPDQ